MKTNVQDGFGKSWIVPLRFTDFTNLNKYVSSHSKKNYKKLKSINL